MKSVLVKTKDILEFSSSVNDLLKTEGGAFGFDGVSIIMHFSNGKASLRANGCYLDVVHTCRYEPTLSEEGPMTIKLAECDYTSFIKWAKAITEKVIEEKTNTLKVAYCPILKLLMISTASGSKGCFDAKEMVKEEYDTLLNKIHSKHGKENVVSAYCPDICLFSKMLREVNFLANCPDAKNISSTPCNAITLEASLGTLSVSSTNMRAIAYRNMPSEYEQIGSEPIERSVPVESTNMLLRLLTTASRQHNSALSIRFFKDSVAFYVNSEYMEVCINTIAHNRHLSLAHHKCHVKSKEEYSFVVLNKKELLRHTKIAKGFTSAFYSSIKFKFSNGKILTQAFSEKGEVEAYIECNYENKLEGFCIAFSPFLLMDICNRVEGDEVKLGFAGSFSACIISENNGENSGNVEGHTLLMPMRIK